MPTQNTPPSGEQKRLAQALSRLRKLNNAGKIPDAAARILDEAHPGWGVRADPTGKLWRSRVDELVAWVGRHDRFPQRQASDTTEHSLAEWVGRYRVYARRGRAPGRTSELDERVPGWRTPPSTRRSSNESAQLIAAYVRETGSLPSLAAPAGGERERLAKALILLRFMKRRGRLPEPAGKILDEACPGWLDGLTISGERQWQNRFNELFAWVLKYGRNPHPSAGDRTERALGGWVQRQRAQAKQGQHPHRIKELNNRLSGWDRSPSTNPTPRKNRN